MKICVISDSHGAKDELTNFLNFNNFDYVCFLGDGLRDIEDFSAPNVKKVSGNCDWFSDEALLTTFEVLGKKILMTHGHKFQVKITLFSLLKKAQEERANIVLYGHTHNQKIEVINEITFLNPGSFKDGDYATIEINEGEETKFNLFHRH